MTHPTERDMLELLHRRYATVSQGARIYAVAEHVPAVTGAVISVTRIADFLAQHVHGVHIRPDGHSARWKRGGYEDGSHRIQLHGHEVKVSRSDWLAELADPTKAEAWKQFCDRWWLVAPREVVRDDLPEGWGLLCPSKDGTHLRVAWMAPLLDPAPMDRATMAQFLRRVQTTATKRAGVEHFTARYVEGL